MKQINKLLIMSGACLIGAGILCAQAPPGPLVPPANDTAAASAPAPAAPKKPEVKPRKDILGFWRFNKDESDDGRAKLKQSREAENTNRGNGGYGGGPRMGGGWPGGPMGGPGYGGQRYPQESGEISDRMGDFVNPPREIRLSQNYDKDPEVLMSDEKEHRTTFFTDGRKLEKDKDPTNKQVAARWEEKKLITDEKGAHNGKVSRSYELSSDGKQLIETVHITDSKGNHPINVQYVYDASDDSGGPYGGH